MKLLNDTPFPLVLVPGRMNFPGHSLTVICKGTFRIGADGSTSVADEQVQPSGDVPRDPEDEAIAGSLRYEADNAPFKPRADVLLVGHCHVPGGRPALRCPVSLELGPVRRTIQVHGDRRWRLGWLGRRPTVAEPFTSMDLSYENAFGGRRSRDNPVGKGRGRVATPEGRARPLPNLEAAERPVTSPWRRYPAAAFGPLRRDWRARKRLLGTYRRRWLRTRWPWFPENFDFGFFNASPPELQVEGYLRGDEPFLLENLHPERPRLEGRLPGVRVRCFARGDPLDADRAEAFSEVSMALDTVWFDTDRELLVLIWRGWTPVRSALEEGLEQLYLTSERLEEPAADPGEHEARLRRLLTDAEEEEPASDTGEEESSADEEAAAIERELEESLAALRKGLVEQGIDPDNPPPRLPGEAAREQELLRQLGFDVGSSEEKLDREAVLELAASGESLAGLDLSGLDLSAAELPGSQLEQAILSGANLSGANLAGANLTAAALDGARLDRCKLVGAKLARADLRGASLVEADLTGASLEGAALDEAELPRAVLEGCEGADLSATDAVLDGVNARKSVLPRADLSRSHLVEADFSAARLPDASMDAAQARGFRAPAADLTGLRASEGVDLSGAELTEARCEGAILEGADLREATLRHALLVEADLSGARLEGADLSCADARLARFARAHLGSARLVKTNLFEADFEAADLDEANLSGANCYGAEFLDARVERLRGVGVNLKMTKLAARRLES